MMGYRIRSFETHLLLVRICYVVCDLIYACIVGAGGRGGVCHCFRSMEKEERSFVLGTNLVLVYRRIP